jgi:hypothetical protein
MGCVNVRQRPNLNDKDFKLNLKLTLVRLSWENSGVRAEKRKAEEEEEESRRKKEALKLLQHQQQEMEMTRLLRSQKQVQDDLAKIAAEEK